MAFTVRKVKIRSAEVKHEAGALANALAPVADARVDIEAIAAYATKGEAGESTRVYCAVSETDRKGSAALKAAGLLPDTASPALLIQGDDKVGLTREIAAAVAAAGISMRVCIGLTSGRKFAILLGFDTGADATKAAAKLRALGAPKKAAKKRA